MRRGLFRDAFSKNAATGNVCVPVERDRREVFDPDTECSMENVTTRLEHATEAVNRLSLEALIGLYHAAVERASGLQEAPSGI